MKIDTLLGQLLRSCTFDSATRSSRNIHCVQLSDACDADLKIPRFYENVIGLWAIFVTA